MQHSIILTTTQSFLHAVDHSELKSEIEKEGFNIVYTDALLSPFSFAPEKVLAIVAGEPEISANAIRLFPNLKIIARFGRGLDNIDVLAAKEKLIIVTSVQQGSTRSVAEHTIGFMFSLAKNISNADRDMKQNTWKRRLGEELKGKILGIIGFGNIGREVAKLVLALGMRVIAFDPYLHIEGMANVRQVDLHELLGEADVISLHVPLVDATGRLINHHTLGLMKPTAFLINTARGGVIDEKDLLDALEQNKLGGAALDVFSEEPPFSSPIIKALILHPRVIATPHVASFTPEAQYEVAKTVLSNITAVKEGRMNDIVGIA